MTDPRERPTIEPRPRPPTSDAAPRALERIALWRRLPWMAAGALSLLSGRDITLTSSVGTSTDGSSIDLQAQGRINAQQGSAISAANANVQLLALGGSVTLESVAAGSGIVRISGTNIVDGDSGVGETEVDITAGQLLLTATSAAGTGV